MQTRSIGSLAGSTIGLGCNNFGWRIDQAASTEVVNAALDSGINFFDTADVYGSGQSEEFLGHALGHRRRNVIVATKFGSKLDEERRGARPDYVKRAAEDSLRRLKTDYVDLYQLHWPDPATPIADTLAALDELVKEGKVREIGCSNFSLEQLKHAEDASARTNVRRFVSLQNEYSLIKRNAERDILPECERLGIAFLPYFPLANGLLTGKYRPGTPPPAGSRAGDAWGPKVFTEDNLAIADSLRQFAEGHGRSMLELAFGWLLSHKPVASVIAGAKTTEQVRANAAAGTWSLSEVALAEIDAIAAIP